MKLMFKRFFLGSTALVVLITGLLVSFPPPTVYADHAERLTEELCVFPTASSSDSSADYHIPTGWLGVEIINRATFKVTFIENGNKCNNPGDRAIEFIDGATRTKPLIDGLFTDSNTSDDNWNYRKDVGNSQKDDSTIDEFEAGNVPNGDFNAQNKIISLNEIRQFLYQRNSDKGAEFTIGIEEQEIDSVECVEGEDNDGGANFQLVDALGDGEDFFWRCSSGGLRDDVRGFRIADKNNINRVFDGKLEAFNITYNYDGTTITHVSSGASLNEFKSCPGRGDKFYVSCSAGGKYLDITKASLDSKIGADVSTNSSTYGDIVTQVTMKDTADSSKSEPVIIAGVNSKSLSDTVAATGTSNPSGDPDALRLECDVSILNPLTWLFCPIIAAANEMVDQLDNAIVEQLNIDTDKYFGGIGSPFTTGNTYYQVWSNFRTVGLVILIIAALVMVISQAIAIGPFDAYTVKKIMPRIFVAIIFMTLSWEVCKFLINLTNDVSIALRIMIQAPFAELGAATIGGKTSAAGTILAGYAGLGLGIVGLLSFAVTALLAVLIAFVVLTLREMAIIFLVLIAPLAIACYILPNTKKAWDFWWGTFSKALLMFPIIMGLIAVGRVFAATASAADPDGESLLTQLVILIAYFGPYFAMPMAFRLAGGAIANIAGIVNDQSRGAFDRLKGFRQNRAQDRISKFRSGGFYNTDTRRGRFGNQMGSFMFDPDEKIPYELGKKGVPGFTGQYMRLGAQVEHESEKQTKEFAQLINEVGGNDKTGRMLSGAIKGFSAETRDRLEQSDLFEDVKDKDGNLTGERRFRGLRTAADYDTAAKILESSKDATEVHGGRALRGLKGHALSLNREGKGFTNVAAAGGLIVASHGFMKEEDLVDVGNTIQGQTNAEFADTMMTQMEVNGAGSGLKVTYSHSRDKAGNIITGTQAGRDWDSTLSKSYGDIAGQKAHAVRKDVGSLVDIVEASRLTKPQRDAKVEEWVSGGMSRDIAEAKMESVDTRASAAVSLLQQMDLYTPGAGDTSIIVKDAMDRLKIPSARGGSVDPSVVVPPRSGGGPGFGPPADPGAPFTP